MPETVFSQRANANQAAFTDNSGGVAANTIPVGAGYQLITMQVPLADLANAQEYQIDPGFAGELIAFNARVRKIASTAAKLATLTGRVNAGALGGGGVINLTTANCGTLGAQVAGSAITGAKSFTAGQTIGFAVSAVTAFAEGEVVVEMLVRNTDHAGWIAAMAAKFNELRTWAVTSLFWKGSA